MQSLWVSSTMTTTVIIVGSKTTNLIKKIVIVIIFIFINRICNCGSYLKFSVHVKSCSGPVPNAFFDKSDSNFLKSIRAYCSGKHIDAVLRFVIGHEVKANLIDKK